MFDADRVAERALCLRHGGSYGYQWFSVQDRTLATMLTGVRAAAPNPRCRIYR